MAESKGHFRTAKYSGWCARCRRAFSEGTRIYWAGPGETYHPACKPDADCLGGGGGCGGVSQFEYPLDDTFTGGLPD